VFHDRAKLTVIAGRGGDGSIHFRREKFVPRGGPDGGDGGEGGDVVLVAETRRRDLSGIRPNQKLRAGKGGPGRGQLSHGADGEDVELKVPVGTQVLDGRKQVGLVSTTSISPGGTAASRASSWTSSGSPKFSSIAARILMNRFFQRFIAGALAVSASATRREAASRGALKDCGLFETATGANDDALERRFRNVNGQSGFRGEPAVDSPQECSAAGQDDASATDVGGKLWRCRLEGPLDRLNDRVDRLRQCGADVTGGDRRSPEEPRYPVAPRNVRFELFRQRPRRPAGDLRSLRALRADQETGVRVHVTHERLVQLITSDSDRLPHDDAAERQDCDLRRAAADVDDHAPLRLAYG